MTLTPKTLLMAGGALVALSVGVLTLARAQSATPSGVDPATHAAHLRQYPLLGVPGAPPEAAGDSSADLAGQVAALREEIAEIRAILTGGYVAPSAPISGANPGMSAVQEQTGIGSMQPTQFQSTPQTTGMGGMAAGGGQPAGMGGGGGGAGQMQRPAGNGGAQPMQTPPGHPVSDGEVRDGHADLVNKVAGMRADIVVLQAALASASGVERAGTSAARASMGSGQMQPAQSVQSQPMPAGGSGGAGGMPGMSGAGGQPVSGGMGAMEDDAMPDDAMQMEGMGGGASGGGAMGGMSGGGGGGGMKMDGMMRMMGMGDMPMGGAGSPAAMNMPSALPGFPGASHIYHVGATGFFLDHPGHITLTLEQQSMLSQQKERALLQQADLQRSVEQGEQELWVLTAADQPDAMAIEQKVQEVARKQGEQRLAFIRAVGEAAKVLSEEQRRQLTGMLPPAPTPSSMPMPPPAPAMPATAPMPHM